MKKYLIALLMLLIPLLTSPVWATDYFIDQSGNGDGDGSSYANRMSMANYGAGNLDASLDPGDTIYLCGTITTEFDTRESGTSGNPIILDGACSGEGGTDATINGTANGIHLTTDDYWTIQNITITNFTGRGIYNQNSDSIIVDSCTISGGDGSNPDHGIQMQRTGGSLLTGIEIKNCSIGTISNANNDTFNRNGIVAQGVSGLKIYNNTVSTTYVTGIRLLKSTAGDNDDNSNCEVYENDITNYWGGGIISHNSDGTIIKYNKIHDANAGLGIGVAYDSDNNEIYGNLIFNTGTNSTNLWNGVDINHDSQTGKVYNNTIYKVSGNCIVIDDGTANCDGWIIKNNIFDASDNDGSQVDEYAFRCNGDSISFVSDYNFLVPHADQGSDVFYDGDDDTSGYTLAEVQNGDPETGVQETHSYGTDPGLNDEASGDFTLESGANAIDAGTSLDYEKLLPGSSWPDGVLTVPCILDCDIGAYDYGTKIVIP